MRTRDLRCRSCGGNRKVPDGREIEELRVQHGISCNRLARELGVSTTWVRAIETNSSLCPEGTFLRAEAVIKKIVEARLPWPEVRGASL